MDRTGIKQQVIAEIQELAQKYGICRALQERNNVPHSYNQKIALEIIAQAKEKFYGMFCERKKEIEDN